MALFVVAKRTLALMEAAVGEVALVGNFVVIVSAVLKSFGEQGEIGGRKGGQSDLIDSNQLLVVSAGGSCASVESILMHAIVFHNFSPRNKNSIC